MRLWRRSGRPSPRLSITVIVYNMRREAPRTLHSLSAAYQEGIDSDDYEVIVVENGSSSPLDEKLVSSFGPNFRYVRLEKARPSPVGAINHGVALSQAPNVGIAIDGARIASPGVVRYAIEVLENFPNPVVSTIALHLGPDVQYLAMARGYDAEEEDRILAHVGWPDSGYRLFEIATLADSSKDGWFGPMAECNFICMPRRTFDRLGGMDERFQTPGGGLVNLDFYNRVCDLEDIQLVCLFGEATFHQIHGGTMTNKPREDWGEEMRRYHDEYKTIRGREFVRASRKHALYGYPHREIMNLVKLTAE